MGTLVAGAWVGEFGWELFCWQGYLRRLSKQYDNIIVYSRSGNELLYNDFAEFRAFNPKCERLNGFRCEGIDKKFVLPKDLKGCDYIDGSTFNIGFNYNGGIITNKEGLFFEQDFIKYSDGNSYNKQYDILINVRNKCSDRDWDYNKWIELISKLKGYKIATIGTKEHSLGVDGIDDHRGIDLKQLSNLMQSSSLLVSPSSGVAHYASLCGLPHLIWSSEFNRLKYLDYWNPFKTECIFYSNEGFNPSVESIYKLIKNYGIK